MVVANAGQTPKPSLIYKMIFQGFMMFFLCPLSSAYAGMIVNEKIEMIGTEAFVKEGESCETNRVITAYYQGKKVRAESENAVYILDLDNGVMIILDLASKSYRLFELGPIRNVQEQTRQMLDKLLEQQRTRIKELPPEMREAMQRKFENIPFGGIEELSQKKIEVKATGKEKQINGYSCDEYEIYENDKKKAIYWLTSSLSTKAMDAYQEELEKWITKTGPLQDLFHKDWLYIRDKGFPIKITHVNLGKGQLAYNREIIHAEEKNLDESYFQPPEDYTQVKMSAIPIPDSLIPKNKTKDRPAAGVKEPSQP